VYKERKGVPPRILQNGKKSVWPQRKFSREERKEKKPKLAFVEAHISGEKVRIQKGNKKRRRKAFSQIFCTGLEED